MGGRHLAVTMTAPKGEMSLVQAASTFIYDPFIYFMVGRLYHRFFKLTPTRRGLPKPWSGPNPNILRSNASSHPNGNIPSQNNPSRNANGRASLPRQNSQKSNVSHDTSAVEATSNNQLIYFLGSLLVCCYQNSTLIQY